LIFNAQVIVTRISLLQCFSGRDVQIKAVLKVRIVLLSALNKDGAFHKFLRRRWNIISYLPITEMPQVNNVLFVHGADLMNAANACRMSAMSGDSDA
jgi:hypothetical protein